MVVDEWTEDEYYQYFNWFIYDNMFWYLSELVADPSAIDSLPTDSFSTDLDTNIVVALQNLARQISDAYPDCRVSSVTYTDSGLEPYYGCQIAVVLGNTAMEDLRGLTEVLSSIVDDPVTYPDLSYLVAGVYESTITEELGNQSVEPSAETCRAGSYSAVASACTFDEQIVGEYSIVLGSDGVLRFTNP